MPDYRVSLVGLIPNSLVATNGDPLAIPNLFQLFDIGCLRVEMVVVALNRQAGRA